MASQVVGAWIDLWVCQRQSAERQSQEVWSEKWIRIPTLIQVIGGGSNINIYIYIHMYIYNIYSTSMIEAIKGISMQKAFRHHFAAIGTGRMSMPSRSPRRRPKCLGFFCPRRWKKKTQFRNRHPDWTCFGVVSGKIPPQATHGWPLGSSLWCTGL